MGNGEMTSDETSPSERPNKPHTVFARLGRSNQSDHIILGSRVNDVKVHGYNRGTMNPCCKSTDYDKLYSMLTKRLQERNWIKLDGQVSVLSTNYLCVAPRRDASKNTIASKMGAATPSRRGAASVAHQRCWPVPMLRRPDGKIPQCGSELHPWKGSHTIPKEETHAETTGLRDDRLDIFKGHICRGGGSWRLWIA